MNRFPLWLNILIGVIVLGGALYALPNLFGESPAVQISAARPAAKVDEALLKRAEDALKQAGIALEASFLDETSAKLRFADTDTQLKAKDVIERALGEDYTVALNLISNSPRWLAAIGAKPMYLGLDLRGGVHFLLQVDMQGAITKSLDSLGGRDPQHPARRGGRPQQRHQPRGATAGGALQAKRQPRQGPLPDREQFPRPAAACARIGTASIC